MLLYVLMTVTGSYLHQCFHTRDHFLERSSWFQELRALHYLHHQGNLKHHQHDLLLQDRRHRILNFETNTPENEKHPEHSTLFAALIERTRSAGLLCTTLLGIHVPIEKRTAAEGAKAYCRGLPALFIRVLFVVACLWCW